MRRITLWLLSTLSALVLLFSYHTSTSAKAATSIVSTQTDAGTDTAAAASEPTASSSPTSSGSTSGTTGGTAAGTAAGTTATTESTAGTATTIDGDVISTRFGNVQVQITVQDGVIVKSVVLQVPWSDHKDQEINSRAVPTLNAEAVSAQSADIDMVSGATFTSAAYIQSLQSAIDKAALS